MERTLRGLKQTLCVPGPEDLIEMETELCLSISRGGTGRKCSAAGTGALGMDMALSPLGGGHH